MKVLKTFKHPDGHEIQLRDHGLGTKPRFSVARVWHHVGRVFYGVGNTETWRYGLYQYLADAERAFKKKVAEAHGDQHE